MYYYKTKIQYEGTNYAGFQWQNGIQTVQGEFNSALSKLIDGKFTTMGASRTDTGVHALDQVVKISCENPINFSSFLEIFNKELSSQVRCIDIEPCEGIFRPATEAISKEYRYFFTNKTQVSKEDGQFIANISHNLNLEAMTKCTRAFVGTHDFCNFYSSGSNVKSTVRNISFCELSTVDPHELFSDFELFRIPKVVRHCYQLKIEANGFLKQMIRHIVSALWMVGSGKISTEEFFTLLDGPKKAKQLWKVASPNGLFLYRINW
ncbi:MAG: tRNA pseudouridine(38-40) synthase TruA [Bdellovibrionales bacterium GWA2_49_15]|nr:MAG: tRNA pseudouridine(38-40) synthase TruA [Bdellovibrionales bacterium GWA2_49_15]HAZ12975.1 tRNA pseudouridine(38-40) synthase TruA [Bdellovibrionales bacterium]